MSEQIINATVVPAIFFTIYNICSKNNHEGERETKKKKKEYRGKFFFIFFFSASYLYSFRN